MDAIPDSLIHLLFFSSTPQINTWTADWIEFYSKHRLGYQLELASRRYGDSAIYEKGTVGKVDLSQYLSFLSGLPNCSSVSTYHFSPVWQIVLLSVLIIPLRFTKLFFLAKLCWECNNWIFLSSFGFYINSYSQVSDWSRISVHFLMALFLSPACFMVICGVET